MRRALLLAVLATGCAMEPRRPLRPATQVPLAPSVRFEVTELLNLFERELVRTGSEFVSAPLSLSPFYALLVSWNVDLEPSAGFEVELRVGTSGAEGVAWSPWLFVGCWGELPTEGLGERCVRFDGGRIATDEFVGERWFDRAQVRLLARDAITPRRVSLCFSGGWGVCMNTGLFGVREVSLPVPARSQHLEDPELAARICSPTSLAMVLAYHGIDVPVAELAALAYDPLHDLYGNWPRSIQAAYSLGLCGYLARYSSIRDVLAQLEAGRPVILSIAFGAGELTGAPMASTSGHLLVVVGATQAGDLVVNDPAAPTLEEVHRVYDRDELERAWLDHGGVAYVLGE